MLYICIWFTATVDSPIVEITQIAPNSFTVDVIAPSSPYIDPNTGELYPVDELPPFKSRFSRSKYGYITTLFVVKPNGELAVIVSW